MVFKAFEKLEMKVQQAINIITFYKWNKKLLKENNTSLNQEIQQAQSNRKSLVNKNEQLNQEWQKRLCCLLIRIIEV